MNSKIEKQEPVAWMQNIEAAMEEPIFQEARALMGTENYGQDVSLLQALRRVRSRMLQTTKHPVEKQVPVAYRVETNYEQPFYWYTDTLPTRGKWSALYTAPQPCPECEKLKADLALIKPDPLCDVACMLSCSMKGKANIERIAELKAELADKGGFFCADCQDTGWLENREEGKYPCTCMTEAEPYQLLKAERDLWESEYVKACDDLSAVASERDELAAQVEKMRAEVELIKGGAENWKGGWSGTIQACDRALALPDLSTSIINRVRAEALRKAADLVIDLGDDSSTLDARTLTAAAKAIADHALAADMEAGKC